MGAVSLDGSLMPSSLDTASIPLPPMPAKSRLKSIFHRRKLSTGSALSTSSNGDDGVLTTHLTLHKSRSRPNLSRSTRSHEKDRSRSTDRRPTSRREKTISDPPPLAQVYSQAILHASLEAPVSFQAKSSNQQGSSPGLSRADLLQESVEVKRSHRRTESGVSACSVKDKMFFLISGPYIMQYDGDSDGGALPEKIFILDRNSVVFASDAVPGRHWVLQVSKRRSTNSARGRWSRLAFKSVEERRIVDTLLLIFNDSEDMCTWLFTIRKEIENLGSEDSRPLTRDEDFAWKEHLTGSFVCSPEMEGTSIHSTSAPPRSSITSPQIAMTRPTRGYAGAGSIRSSTSSKQTRTSLDRLRDSMASDSYTSTIATSADGSTFSTSPTQCKFPSISSVADSAKMDYSRRSQSLNKPRYGKQVAQPKTILERKEGSAESLQKGHPQGRMTPTELSSIVSSSPAPVFDNPSPLREKDKSKEPEVLSPRKSVELKTGPRDEPTSLSRKSSVRDVNAAPPKPKYSLFPSYPPIQTKSEPLANSGASEPSPKLSNANLGKVTVKERSTGAPRHQKQRSRTLTLNARDVRVSAFLAPESFDLVPRSPEVSSDMISFNFGASIVDIPPMTTQVGKVAGLADMKHDLDFLKEPYQQPARKVSQTDRRKVANSKSMTNLHGDATSPMVRAPLGPPPAGPLPAVPTDSRRSSQMTNRSSQWSQSSYWSNSSRKSGHHSDIESKRISTEAKETRTAITAFPSPERHYPRF